MPKKTSPPDPSRQLMIKTKACQRLIKEVAYYHKEVEENQDILDKMKEDKKDPYDIKKFDEVLGESLMMIPDSQARLKQSLQDLATYIESEEVAPLADKDEWWIKGKELLIQENVLGNSESAATPGEGDKDDVVETNLDDLADGEAF
eukprot:Nitzschia sp. Nitz4//scaffold169_size48518//14313//14839//NITZ4_007067-RA/size48518-snap-gene-0.51-mRNA-1//1//CDS//3329538373//4429//frame0